MSSAGRVTGDVLQVFEDVRSRTFARLEALDLGDRYEWPGTAEQASRRRPRTGPGSAPVA